MSLQVVLAHPHIVRLYAAFEDAAHVYLVQVWGLGGAWWGPSEWVLAATAAVQAACSPTCAPLRLRPLGPPPAPGSGPPLTPSRRLALARPQEYASGGDLFDVLHQGSSARPLPEGRAVREVLLPFMQALAYLHAQVGRLLSVSRGGGQAAGPFV